MLENHHQLTQKLLVTVISTKIATTTNKAMTMRMVDLDGVQDDRRRPERELPAYDALATILPFTVAGRRAEHAPANRRPN